MAVAPVDLGVYQILPMCNVSTNIPTTGGLVNTKYQGRGFFMSIQAADLTSLTATGSFDNICKLNEIEDYDARPFKHGDLFFVQYGPCVSWQSMRLTFDGTHYQLVGISLTPVAP